MPDFVSSLQGKDLGHLEIIAELWGIELGTQDIQKGIKQLQKILHDRDLFGNILENIPEQSKQALAELASNQGEMRWSEFRKKYGDIREFGAGKRDRMKPYLDMNASPAEALWYRGLIGRTFFDAASGLEEYIFIPHEIEKNLPLKEKLVLHRLGRPASKFEFERVMYASDWILEDATTLLAGLRCKLDQAQIVASIGQSSENPLYAVQDYLNALQMLLHSAGILDEDNDPDPGQTRLFLESKRGETLPYLFNSWLHGENFNEMLLIPGIKLERESNIDIKNVRHRVLEYIGALSYNKQKTIDPLEPTWWSLPSVVSEVKQESPDYMRPAGDYDSWYIRDLGDGEYLRGFGNWDKVDGNLIYYIITGPLFWLGCVDLGLRLNLNQAKFNDTSAFRFSKWANDLFNNRPLEGFKSDQSEISVGSDARISIPQGTNRALRYNVSRFCLWEGFYKGVYRYRITPSSLESARQQGLTVDHLFKVLNQFGCEFPPNLVKALKSWEKEGSQAFIEERVLLKVSSPEIMTKLRESKASRFFDEPLSPTVIVIKTGARQKVTQALAELGYLADIRLEEKQ